MQDIASPLKKINLEQYQKPKTLIVVHYKGRRISVPLLDQCRNLTQMLYQHIDKFQQTILKSDQKWEVLSQNRIVCFGSSSTDKHAKSQKAEYNVNREIERCLKHTDGDLRIDILLSMIRIEDSTFGCQSIDITKFYKYMEIEPVYTQNLPSSVYHQGTGPNFGSNDKKYLIYRLLEKTRLKNVYLARNLSDGHFYSITVFRSELRVAETEARFLDAINCQQREIEQHQSHSDREERCTVVPQTEIVMIPSEEDEDEENEDFTKYKHLAVIKRYHMKGKLSERLNNSSSGKVQRITEYELLRYLKQLIWIAYTLHETYNIIHRNLTPDSFEIDHNGDIHLTSYTSWIECYNQHGEPIQHPTSHENFSHKDSLSSSSRVYEEEFEGIDDDWYHIGHYTPSQVIKKEPYGKLVDFYTVGKVIEQIKNKVYEFESPQTGNNKKADLVSDIISRLTSDDLSEREKIVLEIIEGMTKIEKTQRRNTDLDISLNEIQLGQYISLESKLTCVENEQNDSDFNGISHQEIINFFKPSKITQHTQQGSEFESKTKPKTHKSREKKAPNPNKASRSQLSNISNSRDKSVKSAKSTSKDKSRTKSKLSSEKNEKSKSKSKKKAVPERISFNLSNNNSKLTYTSEVISPHQKKSKSKSCDKNRTEKSLEKNWKDKKLKSTTLNMTTSKSYQNGHLPPKTHQASRMGRTINGNSHIPLPPNSSQKKLKSPTKVFK